MFGFGRCVPLDRNAKARIMVWARALKHRMRDGSARPKGRAYAEVTPKHLDVIEALLWGFHNAATGKCFPSYKAIAAKADCARSTVYEAISALERAGLLTWVNRVVRVRVREVGADRLDLFGRAVHRWRVIRTSNAYVLIDPQPSKSETQPRTANQFSLPVVATAATPDSGLLAALARLQEGMRSGAGAPRSVILKE